MTITMSDFAVQVRQLKDGRWQVMNDVGASLALTRDMWVFAVNQMSPVQTRRDFCYCKIGAGGKPCVSREYCDEHGGTQQYLDARADAGREP